MEKGDKRLNNLIPVQPGEVRNPKGRPKGSVNFNRILEGLVEAPVDTKDKSSVTKAVELMRIKVEAAMNKDHNAINWIVDRLNGQAAEVHEIAHVSISKKEIKDEEELLDEEVK